LRSAPLLPVPAPRPQAARETAAPKPETNLPETSVIDNEGIEDDRAHLQTGDTILLIIEDDKTFGGLMRDFAREKGFKAIVARNAAQGIALARQIRPSAITLDLHLPDNDGWVVLDRLKHDPKTRHVPIHIISVDPERERVCAWGPSPTSRNRRRAKASTPR
jgi:CheY-like chemotaxis protein